jgi:hypothetical protein
MLVAGPILLVGCLEQGTAFGGRRFGDLRGFARWRCSSRASASRADF